MTERVNCSNRASVPLSLPPPSLQAGIFFLGGWAGRDPTLVGHQSWPSLCLSLPPCLHTEERTRDYTARRGPSAGHIRHRPCGHLVLNIQPPELSENPFLWVKPPRWRVPRWQHHRQLLWLHPADEAATGTWSLPAARAFPVPGAEGRRHSAAFLKPLMLLRHQWAHSS